MKKKEVIFIIGLPGSGKSTLSRALSNILDIGIVSSNSILHNINYQENLLLNKKYISKGIAIPNKDYLKLVVNYIKASEKFRFIIEGFPYNLDQLKKAKISFRENDILLTNVIYIQINEQLLIKRIKERRVCSECGNIYKKRKICPECKIPTVIRVDDEENVFKKRVESQAKQLKEVISYYENKEIFTKIDASESETNKIKKIVTLLKKINYMMIE